MNQVHRHKPQQDMGRESLELLSVTLLTDHPEPQQAAAGPVAVFIVAAGYSEAARVADYLRKRGFRALPATHIAEQQRLFGATPTRILIDLRQAPEATQKPVPRFDASILHLTRNCCVPSSLTWLQRHMIVFQSKPFPLHQLVVSLCDYLQEHDQIGVSVASQDAEQPKSPPRTIIWHGNTAAHTDRRGRSEAELVVSFGSEMSIGYRSTRTRAADATGESNGDTIDRSNLEALGSDWRCDHVAVFSTSRQSLLVWPLFARETKKRHGQAVATFFDDPEALLARLTSAQPRVIFFDAALLDLVRLEFLALIQQYLPMTELILLLSKPLSVDDIEELMSKRVRGCIAIESPAALYMKAANAVCRGEYWFPRWAMAHAISALLGRMGQQNSLGLDQPFMDPVTAKLTGREQAIAALLRHGLSNKEIGRHLRISDATVKKHLKSLFGKLGVHRRTDVMVNQTEGPASDA